MTIDLVSGMFTFMSKVDLTTIRSQWKLSKRLSDAMFKIKRYLALAPCLVFQH